MNGVERENTASQKEERELGWILPYRKDDDSSRPRRQILSGEKRESERWVKQMSKPGLFGDKF